MGTLVARADGESVPVESLKVGMRLVGEDGTSVEVEGVQQLESDEMYRIDTDDGEYTVTPEHLLTLRWARDPFVTLRKPHELPSQQQQPSQQQRQQQQPQHWTLECSWYDATSMELVTRSFPCEPTDAHVDSAHSVESGAEIPSVDSFSPLSLSSSSSSPPLPPPSILQGLTQADLLAWGHRYLFSAVAPSSKLVLGQLLELPASELANRWVEFQMDTPHPLLAARRVPMPTTSSPSAAAAAPSDPANCHSTLLAVGAGNYQPFDFEQPHAATIAYMVNTHAHAQRQ